MRYVQVTAAAAAMFVAFSSSSFAGYDAWIAGGTSVYGTYAVTAAAAKAEVTAACSESEATQCSGAFVLDAGSPVVAARCQSGKVIGYVVGQSRRALENIIAQSQFSLEECVLSE